MNWPESICPFGGLTLIPVDPGTVLGEAPNAITIEDGRAAFAGGIVHLTHDDYARLKQRLGVETGTVGAAPPPMSINLGALEGMHNGR